MTHFLKALRLMGLLSEWSVLVLQDGKITAPELMTLVVGAAQILGVKLEININQLQEAMIEHPDVEDT